VSISIVMYIYIDVRYASRISGRHRICSANEKSGQTEVRSSHLLPDPDLQNGVQLGLEPVSEELIGALGCPERLVRPH
jgi:hypothetical protein